MYQGDDGWFRYDGSIPPLCIAESESPQQYFDVNAAVLSYIKSSYKYGIKHEEAILPCGGTAGEFGRFYFCDFSQRPKDPNANVQHVDTENLLRQISASIQQHMSIDMESDTNFNALRAYIEDDLAGKVTKQFSKKITTSLKKFLFEVGKRDKGYTFALRQVLIDIDNKVIPQLQTV